MTSDAASEDEDGESISVSEGLLTGKLVRIRLKKNNKITIKSVIVAKEKARTFEDWAMGKQIDGATVVSLSEPLSASYY